MDIIQQDLLRSNIGEYYTASVRRTQDTYNELRDDFYNYKNVQPYLERT